ncbi:diguanylate cyclase domain-containing protein [Cyanobium sp. Morenito 9A2]|uniref:bifunctional diguanylate cyclase/phosphodiesterase n=1 Tax=Cyanobium sp. Morenito 9A2 TaxID=2823718 RepID=UPI0020CE5DB2|nr:diguanylate cyclase [Cyanobium sp. Morenito 9A2]MCP9848619.1 diguanylate cyclase [Cyanobium sp. Morenito 9A2]
MEPRSLERPKVPLSLPRPGRQGERRWVLLTLAMVGIFLVDLALPKEVVLLPFYWIPVVLAAGFASPLQVGALSSEALALGIMSSRHGDLFPSVETSTRLLGLMSISIVAILAARERQRREQTIRSLETRFSQIADTVPGVLYEYLQESFGGGRFLVVGAGCRELLELEPEQLLDEAQSFWRLVHQEDVQRLGDLHPEGAASSGSFTADFRITTPSGTLKWLNLSTRQLRPDVNQPSLWCGVMLDITERKQAENNLQRSHTERAATEERLRHERGRLRATLDALIDPHVVLQAIRDGKAHILDFTYLDANSAARQGIDRSFDELRTVRLSTVMPGLEKTGLLNRCRTVLKDQRPLDLDGFAYDDERQGGERRWFDVRAVPMGPDTLSLTWREVSERESAKQRIAASEQRYRLLAENSFDVVMHLRQGMIEWVSPSLSAMLGWRPEDWVGRSSTDFMDPSTHQQYAEKLKQVEAGTSIVTRDLVQAKDGNRHWIESHTKPYLDMDGKPDGLVTSFRTVDSEVEAEQTLERRASTDALTGLLNRHEVLQRLETITPQVRRSSDDSGVLFCDLDFFKSINDTHGHAAGDTVLITVAQRLRRCLRSNDLAARIGGDEMLVLLHGVRDLDNALVIAEKIRLAVAEPISTEAGTVTITLSIGVTLMRTGEQADSLIARADAAMYLAKQKGRNRVIPLTEEVVSGN